VQVNGQRLGELVKVGIGGENSHSVATMLDRGAQRHQAYLVAHTTPYDPAFLRTLATAKAMLAAQTGTVTATLQSYQVVYTRVLQQARLWAFVDNFRLFGFLCLVCLPLIFLIQRLPLTAKRPVDVH
jgi:DHA2 family multidrug resistance protein